MATYIDPFNFRKVLINLFLGNIELFMFAFIIVFSFSAAKMNMSNRIFMILLAIGSIIFGGVLDSGIYTVAILLIGLITYKGVSRIVA